MCIRDSCRTAAAGRGVVILKKKWLAAVLAGALLAAAPVSYTHLKYGFLAIPVVDAENRLVGIVTIDDAISILQDLSLIHI